MGTGNTDVIGGPHDFLPPTSDRSDEFKKLWVYFFVFYKLLKLFLQASYIMHILLEFQQKDIDI